MFTPGPWTLEETSYSFTIKETHYLSYRDHSTNPEDDARIKQTDQAQRQLADAHLIAAAPTMYETLERILTMCGSDDAHIHAAATLALLKARGE